MNYVCRPHHLSDISRGSKKGTSTDLKRIIQGRNTINTQLAYTQRTDIKIVAKERKKL